MSTISNVAYAKLAWEIFSSGAEQINTVRTITVNPCEVIKRRGGCFTHCRSEDGPRRAEMTTTQQGLIDRDNFRRCNARPEGDKRQIMVFPNTRSDSPLAYRRLFTQLNFTDKFKSNSIVGVLGEFYPCEITYWFLHYYNKNFDGF